MKHLVFGVICLSLLIYIFIGAFIFESIERQKNIDRKKRAKEKLILDRKAFLDSQHSIPLQDLQDYVDQILTAYDEGVKLRGVLSSNFTQTNTTHDVEADDILWDFSAGLFFCMTVVTTIGR